MTLEEELLQKHPGMDKRQVRERVLSQIKEVTAKMAATLATSDEGRAAFATAHAKYMEAVDYESKTGLVASPHGSVVPDHLLQFVSNVTELVSELFVCREKKCGLITYNHLWHQQRGKDGSLRHRFRCRACHSAYAPWLQREKLITYNKVLLLGSQPGETSCQVIPAFWSPTAEQKFINLMKEFQTNFTAEDANQLKYENITSKMEQLLFNNPKKRTLKEFTVKVPDMTKVQAWLKDCEGYEHCDDSPKEIPGFYFTEAVPDDEIFNEWDSLINELGDMLLPRLAGL